MVDACYMMFRGREEDKEHEGAESLTEGMKGAGGISGWPSVGADEPDMQRGMGEIELTWGGW